MKYILTLACPDKIGIVAEVSGFLAKNRCNILESAQFNDESSRMFFMRVVFHAESEPVGFNSVAIQFAMDWQIKDMAKKPKALILVSKSSHCLNHLLHRKRIGTLQVEIPAVISNHEDLQDMVEWHKIPFCYLPILKGNKADQEAEILAVAEELKVDFLILARYMQVLSPALCQKFKGRAINIHHSFLPSFKGAKPYQQAWQRGVKIIGATAHYVTENLDEGPIIDQEVIRVDHSFTPQQLLEAGSDIENLVLARAVQYHVENRILLNGDKTVVFR